MQLSMAMHISMTSKSQNKMKSRFLGNLTDTILASPLKLILSLLIGLVIYVCFGLELALFVFIFIFFLTYNIDARILIGVGLIFLIVTPLYLAQHKMSLVENLSVYAFYFFALGVLLELLRSFSIRKNASEIKRFCQNVFRKKNHS